MRRTFNNAVSVIFTGMKFVLMKIFLGKTFKFGLIERFSPNVVTEFSKGSYVEIEDKVRVHSGCKIKVRQGAKLFTGKNTKINYNCIFVCHDEIRIGEGTEFGASVYLYDHDHDYRVGLKENKFKSSPIVIGKNCWVGANTVILRGTVLGDNSIVGAGSVVTGQYEDGSVIVQKRETIVNNIVLDRG